MNKNKATIRTTFSTLKRLLSYTKESKITFYSGLFMSASQGFLLNIILGFGLMYILDAALAKDIQLLNKSMIIVPSTLIVVAIIMSVGNYLLDKSIAQSSGRLRKKFSSHLSLLPTTWFDSQHSGDTMSRLTSDIGVSELGLRQLQRMVFLLLNGVICGIAIFFLDWRMALISLIVGLGAIWITTRFIAPLKKISDQVQAGNGEVSEKVSDLVASGPIIRLYNLSVWVTNRLNSRVDNVFNFSMKRVKLRSVQDTVNALTNILRSIGLIAIGSIGVIYDMISFPQLVAIIQISNGLTQMFSEIGQATSNLQSSLAGADRVFEILDEEIEDIHSENIKGETNTSPIIEIDKLHFEYEKDLPVINDIDITINTGETIALVGGSGSGKSSLIKLLMGLYPITAGNILVYGKSVNDWQLNRLRKNMSYVPQTNYLFSGSIRANILSGRVDATDGEVEVAAKAALAHNFIMELPSGYDTDVGERGAQLSGGQRQRIAIARALIKNAPILLLDEATASLDSKSELQVQMALDTLMEGRTTIVVAHRLSTVQNADRIIVLEEGLIVEQGSHRELIDHEGTYSKLYKIQFA